MTSGEAALARANGLVALRRWQGAMEAAGEAVEDPGTAARALCIIAQCQLGLSRPSEAIETAKKAIAADPRNEHAHRLLAIGYLNTRRLRGARREAEAAVRLAPHAAHSLHVLAITQLAQRKKKDARVTAEASVAANPHSALACLTLARVAAAQRKTAEAEAAYRQGLRLDPDNADLLMGLGALLHKAGRRQEAGDAYLAAGRADPTNARARRGLARIGLPVLAVGIIGKLLIFNVARVLLPRFGGPLQAEELVLALLLVGAVVTTTLRVRGTRNLPDSVRQGLRSEHHNFALGWVRAAAFISLCFAIWAAVGSSSHPASTPTAIALLIVAIVTGVASQKLRVGPRTPFAGAAGALFRRTLLFRLLVKPFDR